MLSMGIKEMAMTKTGLMRTGPTIGTRSLLVQLQNVCAATVLCAPATVEMTKEGALEQADQQMTPKLLTRVDVYGFSNDPVDFTDSLLVHRHPS